MWFGLLHKVLMADMCTGSRDQQVKLWKVDTESQDAKPNMQPLTSILPLRVSPTIIPHLHPVPGPSYQLSMPYANGLHSSAPKLRSGTETDVTLLLGMLWQHCCTLDLHSPE